MSVTDLNNNIDLDTARYNRQNRMNPPEFAPGQGESVDDLFGGSSNDFMSMGGSSGFGSGPTDFGGSYGGNNFGGFDSLSGGGDFFNNAQQSVNVNGMADSFNVFNQTPGGFNTGFNMGPSPNGMMPNNQQGQGFTYDKAVSMTKDTVNGLGKIFSSFGKVNVFFWYNYCFSLFIEGLIFCALSILFMLVGFDIGFPLLLSGLALGIGGIGTSMILKDYTLNCTSEYKEEPNQEIPMQNPEMIQMNNEWGNMGGMQPQLDTGFSESNDWGLSNTFEEEPEEPEEPDESDDWDINEINETPVENDRVNPEALIDSMNNVPIGVYTRQYLYDKFTALLPTLCRDFSTMKEIDSESDAFYQMEGALQEAVEVAGCKETIELKSLKENYATVMITSTRPSGLNIEKAAAELAQIYAHRNNSIKDRTRVYAKVEAVGKECIFTIFTGATEMISLKDMYREVEQYILDTNNYIPVVFGIDPLAEVIVYDLKKLESIIVAGMPRSGKSWFVQNMITQMCAFVSPKELHLYICDPKGDISDFKSFCLPHVKRFETTDERIMEALRYIVRVEAPRRKSIIGAGDGRTASQNIWDYKARHADVELPIIYVVIDEVVTLASRMEKDTFNEFKMILRELISQLPALGIRAILIPHVLNNDIIEKKTSDLVLCRISVCGAADHVEKVTGAKEKDFPYRLTKPGDMAVRMPLVRQEIMYLRAPVLTPSNPENNDLFDYMRQVWNKLEPDGAKGSVAEQAQNVQEYNVAANSIDNNDVEDLDIFAEDETDSYDTATASFLERMNS